MADSKNKPKLSGLEWLAAKTAEAAARAKLAAQAPEPAPVLAPVRHPQRDFYVADLLDLAPKDDMASMEHPLFALKAGDMRVRVYERNGVTLTVKPGHDGCATIHDKDLWIYCISQLVEAMNRGREDVGRVVRFTAYDFLVSTNRDTSGRAYERMGEMFERLNGTRIETNIETDGIRERGWFGFIDHARVVECDGGRMVAVEVALPEWLWRSIKAKHVLTLSRDYFRIRKPLDRRIYELARKHCGSSQKHWQCGVCALHEKSGSTASIREFRRSLKQLVETDQLPDYKVELDPEAEVVKFTKR